MSIDLKSEEVLTLADAARVLSTLNGGGKPVHRSTLYRWIAPGVGGVCLEVLKLGGRTVTSMEALQQFAEQCTAQSGGAAPSPAQDKKRIARIDRELDRHGF